MDVLTSETCWTLNKEIKKASDIKLVSLYSSIFQKWDRVMDWSGLAEDRERWRAFVNKVWTSGFRNVWGISALTENRLVSYEGLCSMEVVRCGWCYKRRNTYKNSVISLIFETPCKTEKKLGRWLQVMNYIGMYGGLRWIAQGLVQ